MGLQNTGFVFNSMLFLFINVIIIIQRVRETLNLFRSPLSISHEKLYVLSTLGNSGWFPNLTTFETRSIKPQFFAKLHLQWWYNFTVDGWVFCCCRVNGCLLGFSYPSQGSLSLSRHSRAPHATLCWGHLLPEHHFTYKVSNKYLLQNALVFTRVRMKLRSYVMRLKKCLRACLCMYILVE